MVVYEDITDCFATSLILAEASNGTASSAFGSVITGSIVVLLSNPMLTLPWILNSRTDRLMVRRRLSTKVENAATRLVTSRGREGFNHAPTVSIGTTSYDVLFHHEELVLLDL